MRNILTEWGYGTNPRRIDSHPCELGARAYQESANEKLQEPGDVAYLLSLRFEPAPSFQIGTPVLPQFPSMGDPGR